MAEKKDKEARARKKSEAKDAKKDAKKAAEAAKMSLPIEVLDAGYATGYETDGPSSSKGSKKKSKSKKKQPKSAGADAGYETDDGYMSVGGKPKKSNFFRLGSSKSKAALTMDDKDKGADSKLPVPPATAPTPQFRLPIAERFATTLGTNFNAGATVDPPLGMPALPPLTTTAVLPPTSAPASMPVSDRESFDKPGPSSAVPKRTVIRFTNNSSDSSTNDSIFSKGLSDVSSSPTSSSQSHSISNTKIPFSTSPLPLSRSISSSPPPPATAQTRGSPSKLRLVPQALDLSQGPLLSVSTPNSRTASPMPGESPFVVLTPLDPYSPIPSVPQPTQMPSRMPSMKGKRPFFGKKSSSKENNDVSITVVTEPPTDTSGIVMPSGEYLTPSPRLQSLPPTTPPPSDPLPTVPFSSTANSRFAFQQQQAPSPMSASRPTSPFSAAMSSTTLARGREAPFPSRPVLPPGEVPGAIRNGRGLESRMKVRRYRELYGLELPSDYEGELETKTAGALPVHRDFSVDPVQYSITSAPVSRNGSINRSGTLSRKRQAVVKFRDTVEFGIAAGGGDEFAAGYPRPDDDWGYSYEDDEYIDETEVEEIRRVAQQYNGRGSSELRRKTSEPAIGRARSFEELREQFLSASANGQLNGSVARPVVNLRQPGARTGMNGKRIESEYDPPSIYVDDVEPEQFGPMEDFPSSVNGDSRRTTFEDERNLAYLEPEEGGGDRSTMYTLADSASIYTQNSRISMMDAEKSEKARRRFLRGIDAMYDKNGRELAPRDYVPPVPVLPASLQKQPQQRMQTVGPDRSGWL